jgi:hypothetical protein
MRLEWTFIAHPSHKAMISPMTPNLGYNHPILGETLNIMGSNKGPV